MEDIFNQTASHIDYLIELDKQISYINNELLKQAIKNFINCQAALIAKTYEMKIDENN